MITSAPKESRFTLELPSIFNLILPIRTRIRPSTHQQWMMAQQAKNNIFVREWILQAKDSTNQVWVSIDWIRAKKIRKHNLMGITLFVQVRGWSVLIFTQVYLSTRYSFFSFLLLRLHAPMNPIFMGAFPLYGPVIFNPSPSLVDHVSDLLDACPIGNLLETLWVVVN